MALLFNELSGFGQASSGQYKDGLGKKTCCSSCAQGGPCTGCGAPPGACRCKGGGLGATTVSRGQADLEPGDYGYQYAQTTKPGTTVTGRRQGFVGPDRRVEITREIEQLEFLAGTPGIHPRVLAQRVWAARRKLMGSGNWEWASYANPNARYDSKQDLFSRLGAVERVLGVGQLSPRLMIAYGSGAMSGLGAWGGTYSDPVAKLASCIRGMLCAPKGFCCPPGRRPPPPYADEFEDEFEDEVYPGPYGETGIPFIPSEIGDPRREPPPWIETGDPRREPPPWIEIGDPRREPPPVGDPRREPIISVGGGVIPGGMITKPGGTLVPGGPKIATGGFTPVNVPGVKAGGAGYSAPGGGVIGTAYTSGAKSPILQMPIQPGTPGMTTRGGQVIPMPRTAQTPGGGLVKAAGVPAGAPATTRVITGTGPNRVIFDPGNVPLGPSLVPGSPEAAAALQAASRARRAGVPSAYDGGSGGDLVSMGGLGGLGGRGALRNNPALNALRVRMAQARLAARRGR